MTDLTQDEIISEVSSIFDVQDIIINTDDLQFTLQIFNFRVEKQLMECIWVTNND